MSNCPSCGRAAWLIKMVGKFYYRCSDLATDDRACLWQVPVAADTQVDTSRIVTVATIAWLERNRRHAEKMADEEETYAPRTG